MRWGRETRARRYLFRRRRRRRVAAPRGRRLQVPEARGPGARVVHRKEGPVVAVVVVAGGARGGRISCASADSVRLEFDSGSASFSAPSPPFGVAGRGTVIIGAPGSWSGPSRSAGPDADPGAASATPETKYPYLRGDASALYDASPPGSESPYAPYRSPALPFAAHVSSRPVAALLTARARPSSTPGWPATAAAKRESSSVSRRFETFCSRRPRSRRLRFSPRRFRFEIAASLPGAIRRPRPRPARPRATQPLPAAAAASRDARVAAAASRRPSPGSVRTASARRYLVCNFSAAARGARESS